MPWRRPRSPGIRAKLSRLCLAPCGQSQAVAAFAPWWVTRARQIKPRPELAMISPLAASRVPPPSPDAPSFSSRSASSTTMTIRCARMSATTVSIVSKLLHHVAETTGADGKCPEQNQGRTSTGQAPLSGRTNDLSAIHQMIQSRTQVLVAVGRLYDQMRRVHHAVNQRATL